MSVTGSGQTDFATRAYKLSINSPAGGSITALQTGGMEYVQVPAAERSQIPGHKPWVSINLNQVSQAKLGASMSQLSSVSSGNPAQALSQLSAVSGTVTRTGSATVDGVKTTVYRAKVNLDKVAAQAQAKAGAKAAQAIRHEEQALGTSILPIQVSIDGQHLIRQIHFQTPIPATGNGASTGKGTATATITFSRYGGPVQVSPPPASQTTDITSEVLQQAKAGSG